MKNKITGSSTDVQTSLKYLASTVQPSIFRNGMVGTKRAPTGDDDIWFGNTLIDKDVLIKNARDKPDVSLDKEGFELHDNMMPSEELNTIDFRNFEDVITRYYPAVQTFVKRVTGANHVFCFDHNIRRSTFVEQKNTEAKVQKPISQVHTDYTPTSAPRRLLDLTQKPKTNDSYAAFRSAEDKDNPLIPDELVNKCTRFCMFNVWRSVSDEGPIQQYPLAVCSSESLQYPDDFVVFEIHYKDRIGENWFIRECKSFQSESSNYKCTKSSTTNHHQWYYYPHMKKSEALIFKQWDSEGRVQQKVANILLEKLEDSTNDDSHTKKMIEVLKKTRSTSDASLNERSNEDVDSISYSDFCIHSAFEDPGTERNQSNVVPDRESIEVRCFALFD